MYRRQYSRLGGFLTDSFGHAASFCNTEQVPEAMNYAWNHTADKVYEVFLEQYLNYYQPGGKMSKRLLDCTGLFNRHAEGTLL